MPGQAGNEGESLSQAPHDGLADVRGDQADRELRQGCVQRAKIPAGRVDTAPAVAGDVEAHGKSLRPSRESQAQCRATRAVVEDGASG